MICPCGSSIILHEKKLAYCRKCGFILKKIKPVKLCKILPVLKTPEEKSVSKIYYEILRISDFLNFSKTNEVITYWKKLFHLGFTSRRKSNAIIGALIYVIARQCNLPLFIDEIAYACSCTEREINRMQKQISRKLNVKIILPKPEDFIPKFIFKLNLPFKVAILAENLCSKIKNHSYRTIAVLSILIASKSLSINLNYNQIQLITKVHKNTLVKLLKNYQNRGVRA